METWHVEPNPGTTASCKWHFKKSEPKYVSRKFYDNEGNVVGEEGLLSMMSPKHRPDRLDRHHLVTGRSAE